MLLPEICGHQAASPSKRLTTVVVFIYSCYRKENGPWSCKDPSESRAPWLILPRSLRFICKLDSVNTIAADVILPITRAAHVGLDDRAQAACGKWQVWILPGVEVFLSCWSYRKFMWRTWEEEQEKESAH